MFAHVILDRVAPCRPSSLVIDIALQLYIWLLIAAAMLSWLIAFNVVNMRNPVRRGIADFLYRITEPALRPIRNMHAQSRRHRHFAGDPDPDHHLHPSYVIALYIYPNVL